MNEHYITEELQRRLEKLGATYASLLEEFKSEGNIDIFAEFDQDLLCLEDEIGALPLSESEERFELYCGVNALKNGYNSLLHTAS